MIKAVIVLQSFNSSFRQKFYINDGLPFAFTGFTDKNDFTFRELADMVPLSSVDVHHHENMSVKCIPP